ncbi:MAG: hypothetical protein ABH873_04230 [Candidatus Firestonebacteria bacterium]
MRNKIIILLIILTFSFVYAKNEISKECLDLLNEVLVKDSCNINNESKRENVQEYYKNSIKKLSKYYLKVKNDSEKERIIWELMAFHNGLDEYDKSLELMEIALAQSSNTAFKEELLVLMPSLKKNSNLIKKGDVLTEDDANDLMKSYEDAMPVINKINKSNYFYRKIDYYTSFASFCDSIGKYDRAFDLSMTALSILRNASKEERNSIDSGRSQNYPSNEEYILQSTMLMAIKAKKEDETKEMFKQLLSLSNKIHPDSYYAEVKANAQYGNHTAGYIKEIEEWLRSHKPDGWTNEVKYRLLLAYYSNGQYDIKEAKLSSELYYSDLAKNNETIAAQILYCKVYSLFRIGEKKEAKKALNLFKAKYKGEYNKIKILNDFIH